MARFLLVVLIAFLPASPTASLPDDDHEFKLATVVSEKVETAVLGLGLSTKQGGLAITNPYTFLDKTLDFCLQSDTFMTIVPLPITGESGSGSDPAAVDPVNKSKRLDDTVDYVDWTKVLKGYVQVCRIPLDAKFSFNN
ncbi:hypothetical protein BBP40_010200 [Aspergillus hancockii]|nr:hypothetical protein BBP40_010200 [Aspergillus hancockii]